MKDYKEIQKRMEEVTARSALEVTEHGEISDETATELNELIGETITYVLTLDKDLHILKESETNKIKQTRRQLLESPGVLDGIPFKQETSKILTMFILAVSFLNQEREADEAFDKLLESMRSEEENE